MTDGHESSPPQGIGDADDKQLLAEAEALARDIATRADGTVDEHAVPFQTRLHYQIKRQHRLDADIKAAAQSDELDLTNRDLRGLDLRGDTDQRAVLIGVAWNCNTKWPQARANRRWAAGLPPITVCTPALLAAHGQTGSCPASRWTNPRYCSGPRQPGVS